MGSVQTSDASPAPCLGLALGGGALGAAHAGVLRALRERRILPRVVVGTSAGALVGAAYAAGLTPDQIDEAVRRATWSDFGSFRPSLRLGLLDSAALIDTIRLLGGERYGENPRIEDLRLPFAATATDLRTRSLVILDRGPLAPALRASMAVPGIFPPVVTGAQILVDGGLADNLPIDAARRLGATFTIAVRLRPEWDRLPVVRERQNLDELENADDVLMIRPDLERHSQWTRHHLAESIEAGYAAASKALDADSYARRQLTRMLRPN